ncbi:MAG: SEC-C domain-containing protein [SAR324 cluster bacterium]|nr:SEC-C domain-containing protein [SAR324 cluster bacterium]
MSPPGHFSRCSRPPPAQGRGELPGDPDLGYFTDTIEEFSRWYSFSSNYLCDQEKLERREQARSWKENRQGLDDIWKITGRNDPCPCGSGRKYKKCCPDG